MVASAIISYSSGIYAQNLQVTVTPVQNSFTASEDVKVTVKYSNIGSTSLSIYKWLLPDSTLNDKIFEITCNGNSVRYVGPLARRRVTNDDIYSLAAGRDVTVTISVSPMYDMSQSCNYNIRFNMPVTMVFPPQNPPVNLGSNFNTITSNIAVFYATGRSNALLSRLSAQRLQGREAPIFVSTCNATQQTRANDSMTEAKRLAVLSQFYLKRRDPSATTRFTTWFGTFTPEKWNILQQRFEKIQDALANKNISFDCNCTSRPAGVVAFVYSSLPYTIYLCPTFFQMSITGSDSASGSIIHELSHFDIIAGTQDHAYGTATCQNLARTDPDKAFANADSHEFFAENEPPLP